MTGWQSGGGDQGGWNPNQPFGPEAQTSKYGTDPYGADPYGNQYDQANPYGTDPYGGGYDQYGQYQQYPPTGGFSAQGYGPPPPEPKRSKLPMILSLVAIVIIVGAVVAIVLVNRQNNQPVAEQDKTSSQKAPSSPGGSSSSGQPTSQGGGGDRDDWLTIDNTGKSGLSYQVPPDWKQSPDPTDSGLKVDFTGVADYGTYECEGSSYFRARVASGDVQGSGGKDLDLPTTVEDFANSFARQYYGENAKVDVPAPTETEVDGKPAMTLTAKVTVEATGSCAATEAEVALVGVQVQDEGQPKGVAMLVVANDLAGGPAEPKPLAPSVTQEILSTVSAK